MKYKFEPAYHIDDYLAAIKDRPEFVVAVKDGGYTVINYLVQSADTFADPMLASDPQERRNLILRRECRGLVFNTETGNVIARRLHKFFNVNERDETQLAEIDWNEPHVILEKLDGSMITPIRTAAGIRWGTKMGVTQVALPVEEFVAARPIYTEFALLCESRGFTPIFEWTSRQQRIVIDYPVEALTVIAIRNNKTGEYMPHEKMCAELAGTGIPVVKAYSGTASSMEALIAETRDLIGVEGYVVRFSSGHMIKVKAEDYLRLHRAKDMISLEKNVIELVASEKVDDVKAFLQAEDLCRITDFESNFWKGVQNTVSVIDSMFTAGYVEGMSKRDYAVNFVQKQEAKFQRFLYAKFDQLSTMQLVIDAVKNNCGSQTKVNEARWLHNTRWNEITE